MASVRQIPGRKVWIACYTDGEGRRRQKSTKTRNRDKAQKIAEAYEFAARKEQTFSDIMATIAGIMEIQDEKPVYTLKDYVKKYLERKKDSVKPATYANAERSCKVLVEGLGEKADKPMLLLETSDLDRWKEDQLKRVRKSTVHLYQQTVIQLFRKAHAEQVIPRNIATKDLWPLVKPESAIRTAFRDDQLRDLLKVAKGEWRGLIFFGVYTGQRLGDLAALTWKNIDTEKNLLTFTTKKNERQTVLPIATPLARYIAEELPAPSATDAPLFPESAAVPVKYLSQGFDRLLRDAGLREGEHKPGSRAAKRSRNPLSFHSLRHTATTFMSAAGINEDAIMQVVGHESAAVSRGYNHEEIERKRTALAALPDLLEEK